MAARQGKRPGQLGPRRSSRLASRPGGTLDEFHHHPRDGAAGARHELPCLDRLGISLCRPVRNRLGDHESFQSIAESKNTSLAVVAPGIAEALFATALGLAAAIPAVIAYNKFAGDLDRVGGRLETFAQEFSTLLARQLDEGGR